jgi:hypothetical protein
MRRPRPLRNTAFLNIPYDRKFETLYLAFIAGLCGFGLIPRATLEIPGSQRRLDRIFELIDECTYSFHDISRVELDRRPPHPAPRFNMPFELGLVVAWAKGRRPGHQWFVFEAVPHRLKKSLSDLDGTDPYIHRGKPDGVLSEIRNALTRSRHRPALVELRSIYDDLKKAATSAKKDGADLFEARSFADLVIAAKASARSRIASLRAEL